MKKYLIAFLIVFVAVACWQCGDKGEDDPAPDPKIEITGSPEVNLPAAGGNGVISFTTNVAWSAKVNDTKASSWCSISPESGKAGDVKITVTAKKIMNCTTTFQRKSSLRREPRARPLR